VERERERGGECACTTGVRGELATWLLVSSSGVMPHACILAIKCLCHLVHAWLEECPKLLGRDTNLSEYTLSEVTWLEHAMDLIL
jgi:hypothetical protein